MDNDRIFDQTGDSILGLVREGMHVYDASNHDIGTVKFVHMGAASPAELQEGEGPATAPDIDMRGESWLDAMVGVFSPEKVPDVIKSRLLREGFIQIDTRGLFSADRFALREQVAGVDNGRVVLNVSEAELAKNMTDPGE